MGNFLYLADLSRNLWASAAVHVSAHPTSVSSSSSLSSWEIVMVIVSSAVAVLSFFYNVIRERHSDRVKARDRIKQENEGYIKTTLEAMKQLTDDLRAEVERQKEEREESERRSLEKEQRLLAEIARLGLEVRALREQLKQNGVSLPQIDASLMAMLYPNLVLDTGVKGNDKVDPNSRS